MKVYIVTEYYPATNGTVNHSVVSTETGAINLKNELQAKHNLKSESPMVMVGYQTFTLNNQLTPQA